MKFDLNSCKTESFEADGQAVQFLAFREVPYATHPVCPEYQRMNIFIPAAYRDGSSVNGYTRETAPIFMPNTVGGYMPGPLDEPGLARFGPKAPNSIFYALCRGYVVVAPALRGRVLKNESGDYVGKAPACIVDYKAAVRYVRSLKNELPGDKEKIITNGTSAGGALSSLMGATGNAAEYAPYLEEIGAANERDDIFAASCYCPITNLDHADMAYEWQFAGVKEYQGWTGSGSMSDEQMELSAELAKAFPVYVNSLGLTGADGSPLTLNADGTGSFLNYVKARVVESAQCAVEQGEDISGNIWLTFENGKPVGVDFPAYVRAITRMKTAPAFDSDGSPETDLFGSKTENRRHFTKFAQKAFGGLMAEQVVIDLMNPLNFLTPGRDGIAKHWRIRHGECDRDTSLAISAILTLTLESIGYQVDYHLPWGRPHSGDYDLDELFDWVDSLCK